MAPVAGVSAAKAWTSSHVGEIASSEKTRFVRPADVGDPRDATCGVEPDAEVTGRLTEREPHVVGVGV